MKQRESKTNETEHKVSCIPGAKFGLTTLDVLSNMNQTQHQHGWAWSLCSAANGNGRQWCSEPAISSRQGASIRAKIFRIHGDNNQVADPLAKQVLRPFKIFHRHNLLKPRPCFLLSIVRGTLLCNLGLC